MVRADWRPPNSEPARGRRRRCRRHRHAGQHHQQQQGDDDAEVGELLQHVVAPRLLALGKPQPRVVEDRRAGSPRKSARLGTRSRQMAAQRRGRRHRRAPLKTNSQAKKKCQRRPIARSCSAGRVAQDGNPRASISPSDPGEAPRKPVVSNEWPKMVVTPATGLPSSSSFAENPRNGCSNWVAWPQLKPGRALKICSPLIRRIRKQIALTQWQTRTTAECRRTMRGTATGRDGLAEETDAMSTTPFGKVPFQATDAQGESFATCAG